MRNWIASIPRYFEWWIETIKNELQTLKWMFIWYKESIEFSSNDNGVRKYYYRFWVDGKHCDIPYPVYIESDKILSLKKAIKMTQSNGKFLYEGDAIDVCCCDCGPIRKMQYDVRLDPKEYVARRAKLNCKSDQNENNE